MRDSLRAKNTKIPVVKSQYDRVFLVTLPHTGKLFEEHIGNSIQIDERNKTWT